MLTTATNDFLTSKKYLSTTYKVNLEVILARLCLVLDISILFECNDLNYTMSGIQSTS